MRNILLVSSACALLTSCAAGPPSAANERFAGSEKVRLEQDLRGKTPGTPKRCIDLRDASGPESYGDTTLVFRVSSTLVYRTETGGGCEKIGRAGRGLVIKSFNGQLCKGDPVEVADFTAGIPYAGFCRMGEFTPYRGRRPKQG
jgi:hypothetical protein